jgi:hypothetical protein
MSSVLTISESGRSGAGRLDGPQVGLSVSARATVRYWDAALSLGCSTRKPEGHNAARHVLTGPDVAVITDWLEAPAGWMCVTRAVWALLVLKGRGGT